MGFAVSGLVGAGAQDALAEMLKERLVQEQLDAQKQQQAFDNNLNQQRFDETVKSNRAQQGHQAQMFESSERSHRDRSNAAGVETLFRTRGVMDEEDKKRRVLDVIQRIPEGPGRLAAALGAEGIGVAASALESPDERAARERGKRDQQFEDFQRRAQYQDSLIRGRQRDPQERAVMAKDRQAALRQGRQDAIAHFNASKDPLTGQSSEDLEALIDEYQSEYLDALEAIAAADDNGASEPQAVTPAQGSVPVHPSLAGAPNARRVVSGLTRRPTSPQPAAGGSVIKYDAQGNRIR